MALLFNTSSPILVSSSSSSSSSSQLKYFVKTKLFGFATRSAPKQYCRRYAVSPSTTQAQEYHFDSNDVVFQANFEDEYEEKIEKMRELVVEWREEEDPMEKLMLVDTIQRLGVGHHFEKEIEMIMKQHYYYLKTISGSHSLHHVALSFRLLRQRGYHVSADVLKNFKGKDGKFRDDLKQDIWGLLELYEATQLSFEGESILEEAADFSTQILYQHLAHQQHINFKHSNIVEMRLRHPYHKTITKFTDHSNFLNEVGGMTTSTELSELDFLRGKHTHKQELLQVSKWWKDEDLNRELKLARNQPLKWYTWSMAILMDDINLSEQRVLLTKSIAFIYLIDDVFDLYGTLHHLEIFCEAVNKWEYAAIDMLPEYMKLCYKSLLDTTNQIATTIYENHGYNPINILKQTWGSLCNAFLVEAKWLGSRNLPRAEEYLANGKVSSGVHVVLVHLFFLLGLHETNIDEVSALISRVAAILRLWDDLGSAEDEHQEGRDGSYIECYMRDEPGLAFEEAREHVVEMIGMEWKRLNKECFNLSNHHSSPSPSLDQFQEAALNLARMVPLMYTYDHNQCLPLLKQYLQLMLLDPPSLDLSHTKQEQHVLF